jgi:hypothetical protein
MHQGGEVRRASGCNLGALAIRDFSTVVYTGCPRKKRRVHNSLIYQRILNIIHQIKWLSIGYKKA